MNSPTVAKLRQLARPAEAQELCELCRIELPAKHRHLLEMSSGQILCACDGCALRFQNVVGGHYKLIPRDAHSLPGFAVSDAWWESLSIPINLAFFFYSSEKNSISVMYPSPAGATESLLPLNNWEFIKTQNPALDSMQGDVEALLVNRVNGAHLYFIAPIDCCFELVGLIRLHWRGLSGGEMVWQQIQSFFERLKAQTDDTCQRG